MPAAIYRNWFRIPVSKIKGEEGQGEEVGRKGDKNTISLTYKIYKIM